MPSKDDKHKRIKDIIAEQSRPADAPLDYGDVVVDLLKTVEGGRRYPVCPCGGRVDPCNLWHEISYYRCRACGHRFYDGAPKVTAPTPPLPLDELKEMLKRIKRAVERDERKKNAV